MSYKSFNSGGSSTSKKGKPRKELYQENFDLITDPSVENEICLSCDDYEFKGGTLIVRANTSVTVPLGTNLKII
tara:strand:+ start:1026 stop:1247 length:222 start_codon:yes stop_codon:yes gene_type:complete